MSVWVIIPAAGSGERMKSEIPKIFLDVAGRPVIWHTLRAFEACPLIDGMIIVGGADSLGALEALVRKEGFRKVRVVVAGGATRTQSVRNGLKAVAKDVDIVLIHDGARPLVTRDVIERVIHTACEHGAAVAGIAVKPTLKVVDPRTDLVSETLDRTLVREIQTPQGFRREILERAYALDENASDDAGMVEKIGVAVKIVPGDRSNIKITTPEDMAIAEALLKLKGDEILGTRH